MDLRKESITVNAALQLQVENEGGRQVRNDPARSLPGHHDASKPNQNGTLVSGRKAITADPIVSIPFQFIMPRNRRRVVDAMSDNIEEEDDAMQSQHRDVDAVDAEEDEEEADQQPRPPRRTLSRSGKAESSGMAAARTSAIETERERDGDADADADADEDEDATDATPAFDADSFGNKPLSRHDGQRLQGMASDWNMMETNLKDNAFSLLTRVSTAVAEYADESMAKKVGVDWGALLCPHLAHADRSHT